MRLSFRLGAAKLTLLSLALLCLVPRTVTSYPRSPTSLLPPADGAQLDSALLDSAQLDSALLDSTLLDSALLDSALLHLRDALDDDWMLRPGEEKEEGGSWEEKALLRAQRGDLVVQPLSPFPVGLSLESMNYQEGGEGEDGGKRNEALTSIAGGLQAISREKGGTGFRFGRKRWTDRGWMD
ncbi:uncharacterized protein qrfp [Anarhichas minor]|uniref:uncharacterized protein qrfp n=1 Tax=Anarhichas minor TaxID=65739 RepID=UPI003F73A055